MEEKTSYRNRFPDTEIRDAHGLYVLHKLDRYQRLEPYLYRHIIDYQAYDPSIHTSE